MCPGYSLEFYPDALKEWNQLDGSVKNEFKKVIEKRLVNPYVESARLTGELHNCFKIKSKKSGYRVVYTVIEQRLVVVIIAIAKRERLEVYKKAKSRI
jgi:mRNA interferase RelE/StbE